MTPRSDQPAGAADSGPTAVTPERREVVVDAVLLGERIDTRGMEQAGAFASTPVVAPLGDAGRAVLFRYGVVVYFGVGKVEQAIFGDTIAPRIADALETPERETLRLVVTPDAEEAIDPSGTLILRELKVEHMQLIADAIAKSVVLARYEGTIDSAFDRIEPLAARLKQKGSTPSHSVDLLRHVGDVLLAQQHMVGRVAVGEKPDVLWDHPKLERLHARLADWYELIERDRAIDRKLDMISRTAGTLNDLLQHRRSLRVEWYIVILIIIEIILTLFQMVSGLAGH